MTAATEGADGDSHDHVDVGVPGEKKTPPPLVTGRSGQTTSLGVLPWTPGTAVVLILAWTQIPGLTSALYPSPTWSAKQHLNLNRVGEGRTLPGTRGRVVCERFSLFSFLGQITPKLGLQGA